MKGLVHYEHESLEPLNKHETEKIGLRWREMTHYDALFFSKDSKGVPIFSKDQAFHLNNQRSSLMEVHLFPRQRGGFNQDGGGSLFPRQQGGGQGNVSGGGFGGRGGGGFGGGFGGGGGNNGNNAG
jgi:hypothetical protein